MGNFAILAFVDPIGIVTTPSGMEIFESQGHGSLRQLAAPYLYAHEEPGPDFKLYTQI